jgi:Na+-translocating ferredoxin:NAD+ oxidoreductase RnfD subunit
MASLSDQQLKDSLKEMYPNSSGWHRKVDTMSKAQAFAIYMRFEEQKQKEERQEIYVQATLF